MFVFSFPLLRSIYSLSLRLLIAATYLYHGHAQISYTDHLRLLNVVLDTIRSKDSPAVMQQFSSLNLADADPEVAREGLG